MKSRICSRCKSHEMRRINRRSFWDRVVLTRLGYYPWECVFCRERVYLKDAGNTRSARRAEEVPARKAA